MVPGTSCALCVARGLGSKSAASCGAGQYVLITSNDLWYAAVLLLSCCGPRCRFTPHTAFHDPTAPADSPPRESIEVRSLVFWPKEQAQGQGGAAAAGDASAAV